MKYWLITGGCGFIGTRLVQKLVEHKGYAVRIIDNLTVGTPDDLGRVCAFEQVDSFTENGFAAPTVNRVQLIVADILNPDLALQAGEGMDVVVHLAANTGVGPSVEDPRADMLANVVGTFNYLESARMNKIPRFIFASSGAPAGEVDPPIHEELPPHPVSPYGASKLAGEGYCSAYKRTFGIDTVMLRFGNVYGPGSGHKNSVVAKFIRQALRGETLEMFGDGTQTRDFIFSDDLIRALMNAVLLPDIGGEAFQIATNRETTVREMAELLLAVLEEAGVARVPLINASQRLGDVKRNYSDTTKARQRLGWIAETNLQQGLKRTVDYFLNNRDA